MNQGGDVEIWLLGGSLEGVKPGKCLLNLSLNLVLKGSPSLSYQSIQMIGWFVQVNRICNVGISLSSSFLSFI